MAKVLKWIKITDFVGSEFIWNPDILYEHWYEARSVSNCLKREKCSYYELAIIYVIILFIYLYLLLYKKKIYFLFVAEILVQQNYRLLGRMATTGDYNNFCLFYYFKINFVIYAVRRGLIYLFFFKEITQRRWVGNYNIL